jgi:hypothetical protein
MPLHYPARTIARFARRIYSTASITNPSPIPADIAPFLATLPDNRYHHYSYSSKLSQLFHGRGGTIRTSTRDRRNFRRLLFKGTDLF